MEFHQRRARDFSGMTIYRAGSELEAMSPITPFGALQCPTAELWCGQNSPLENPTASPLSRHNTRHASGRLIPICTNEVAGGGAHIIKRPICCEQFSFVQARAIRTPNLAGYRNQFSLAQTLGACRRRKDLTKSKP
jgi:hypothetical protein